MNHQSVFLAGVLSLVLLAGCQTTVPVAPTADASGAQPAPAVAPAAVQPGAQAPAQQGDQPAAPANATLNGKAAVFGAAFANATVQVLPLSASASASSAQYAVLSASAPLATGTTNDDGAFSLKLPEGTPAGTPLKVLVTKNGQALVTALLAGQTSANVRVTQSTTLAFLIAKLDKIGRGLYNSSGQLVSDKAAEGMVHAFQALADATEKGVSNSGEGADVVAKALKAKYAADGHDMTDSLAKAFSRAAKDVATVFGEAAKELNGALRTAKEAGGETVTSSVELGSLSTSVTNSSGGGSSSGPAPETPEIQVEATGTFAIPVMAGSKTGIVL